MNRLPRSSLRTIAFIGIALCLHCGDVQTLAQPEPPSQAEAAREAVARIIPLLQSSGQTWIEATSCVSCHHQGLGTMSISLARERGIAIDEQLLSNQLEAIRASSRRGYADLLQGEGGINGNFGRSFEILALAAADQSLDDTTAAIAHYLMGMQSADGGWPTESHRPPMESSRMTATAVALRSLKLTTPPGRVEEASDRILRATKWLQDAAPLDNEDRTMRVLGLTWAEAPQESVRAAAADLLSTQRADGGWAQLPTSQSDAYATGQALVALHLAGVLNAGAPEFQRGVTFLLNDRESDGTWRVRTRRRMPGLPHFETGFPHGTHQFISYAASAWAVMALTLASAPGDSLALNRPTLRLVAGDRTANELGMQPIHMAAAFGNAKDVIRELQSGAAADAKGPGGVTPLMLAVHDHAKVQALLKAGASASAVSTSGWSVMHLAAAHSGAARTLRELCAADANGLINAANPEGITVALRAARSADISNLAAIADAGADLVAGTADGVTPLFYATFQGNADMVRWLLDRGIDVNSHLDDHQMPLHCAAMDGWYDLVDLLLQNGATVDARDEMGMTPLAFAAMIDHGDSRIVRSLLAAGANPDLPRKNGRTPRQLAKEFANAKVAALLLNEPLER